MKILHVVNDANTGGAQTLIEALMLTSEDNDEMHLLVLLDEGGLSARFAAAAKTVTYVHMHRGDIVPARAIRTLTRLVRDHRIDVVHSHLHQSDLVNLLARHGRPRVSTLHSSLLVASNPVARTVWYVTARLSGRFDAVAACSASARRFAEELGYRYPPDDMQVIHNGTETAPSPSPRPDDQVFLQLARYSGMKDHPTMFRAFAEVAEAFPRARLRCAGHAVDDGNAALTVLLDDLGIRDRVVLLGSVDNVRAEIRSASAVVFSSWHEALPMAGIEAISEGTPVITTDTGDARAVAVSRRAVVPPRDPEALGHAMRWFLELSPAEQQLMRQSSWQLAVDEFDIRSTAEKYRKLYRSVLGLHRHLGLP